MKDTFPQNSETPNPESLTFRYHFQGRERLGPASGLLSLSNHNTNLGRDLGRNTPVTRAE